MKKIIINAEELEKALYTYGRAIEDIYNLEDFAELREDIKRKVIDIVSYYSCLEREGMEILSTYLMEHYSTREEDIPYLIEQIYNYCGREVKPSDIQEFIVEFRDSPALVDFVVNTLYFNDEDIPLLNLFLDKDKEQCKVLCDLCYLVLNNRFEEEEFETLSQVEFKI